MANTVAELLGPRNVAILGASPRPGSWSRNPWEKLHKYGFPGAVYLINPRYEEVFGAPCYPSFAALPEPPDHVVVAVAREAVIPSLEEAAKCGARSATIFAGGFGEGGDPEGRRYASELRDLIERTGLAVSGPNCMGNRYSWSRLVTLSDERLGDLVPGPVVVLGQSGGVITALSRSLQDRGIRVGAMLTTGNEIGLQTADYLDFFAEHDDVQVVVSYVEGVKDIDRFLAGCRHMRERGKTCVMYKVGGSPEAQAAALAHTGTLVGSREAFEAVAAEVGVVSVRTLDEVIEATEFLTRAPRPKGDRIVLTTISGGLKGLALAATAALGITLPQPSAETTAELSALLGVGSSLGNPLDRGPGATLEANIECLEILMRDENFDVLLLQAELLREPGERTEDYLLAVEELAKRGTRIPIALFSMLSHQVTDFGRKYRSEQFPHLPFLQEPMKAISVVTKIGALEGSRIRLEAANETAKTPRFAKKLRESWLAKVSGNVPGTGSAEERALTEPESKELVSIAGLVLPQEVVASTEAEAVAAAKKIGLPVVLKLVSSQVTHKASVGGVFTGLASEKEVRSAYAEAHRIQRDLGNDPENLGKVIVAEQIGDGIDIAIGTKLDPEFGQIVMVGIGGALVEVGGAPACVRAAAPSLLIREAVEASQAATLLRTHGFANRVKQLTAAAEVVAQIANCLGDSLAALDLNPLRFSSSNKSAVVLDALAIERVSKD